MLCESSGGVNINLFAQPFLEIEICLSPRMTLTQVIFYLSVVTCEGGKYCFSPSCFFGISRRYKKSSNLLRRIFDISAFRQGGDVVSLHGLFGNQMEIMSLISKLLFCAVRNYFVPV
jgi:hypothetical protein